MDKFTRTLSVSSALCLSWQETLADILVLIIPRENKGISVLSVGMPA